MGFYRSAALGRFGIDTLVPPAEAAQPASRVDRFLTARAAATTDQAAADQARELEQLTAQLEAVSAAVPEGEPPSSGVPTWVLLAGGAVALVVVGGLVLRSRSGKVGGYRRRRRHRR